MEKLQMVGIASKDEIESLINKQGHFYASNKGIKCNATYQDVKKELKSQINYAVDNGLDPNIDLDTHMGSYVRIRYRSSLFWIRPRT